LGQTGSETEKEILLIVQELDRRKPLLNCKPQKYIHRYGESILSTWETSFSAIAQHSPMAARVLSLLAFLNLDDIFLDLFRPDISSTARLKMVCLVLIKDGGLSWQAEILLIAIRLSRLLPSSTHSHLSNSGMNNLALVLSDQDKYEQAEEIHRQALG
jgi:hypothetical protein